MEIQSHKLKWTERFPIFSDVRYLSSLGKKVRWYAIRDENAQTWILACVEREGFFKIIQPRTEPFNLETGDSADTKTELLILNAFLAEVKRKKAIVSPAPINALSKQAPPGSNATNAFASCLINLNKPEETLWKNLHGKHRNVIRRAENLGVHIESGEEFWDAGYDTYCKSQERSSNTVESREWYINLLTKMENNAVQYVAIYEGIVQASALILYSQYGAYYLHGGSINAPVSGASNLLHWHIMLEMKARNVQKYDLMGIRSHPEIGSKYEGIRRFKERFGGEIKTGYLWHIGFDFVKYSTWKVVRKLRGAM